MNEQVFLEARIKYAVLLEQENLNEALEQNQIVYEETFRKYAQEENKDRKMALSEHLDSLIKDRDSLIEDIQLNNQEEE